MKKIIFHILSMTLIFAILLGCQSNGNNELVDAEVSKVSISKSSGLGKVNSNFFTVYEDEETLEIFKNIILNAVKETVEVYIVNPHFDLELIFTDETKQGYHLWLGEKGQESTLMKIDDIPTIYSISEEMTKQLIDLIQ
ncbi:hypothetical protein [Chengkuizengella marina]|uniref:YhfM-like domain-containing protein n=1 Tax=Chengkuizengella marina TaxID=2507566 RepID=A0A6N9Q0D1_9BACL|nr:hypothetical protein [Chengkuizengella marina]NBI28153.1 hypothetical protein [Chengkuizengella marina]